MRGRGVDGPRHPRVEGEPLARPNVVPSRDDTVTRTTTRRSRTTCPACGSVFQKGRWNQKFCEPKCKQRWYVRLDKDRYRPIAKLKAIRVALSLSENDFRRLVADILDERVDIS